jgi:hypothetical protein
LKGGPARLTAVRDGFVRWADEHGVRSLQEIRGCASLERCADPAALERGNYVDVLRSVRPTAPSTR